jgi:hypothetical protein
VPIRSRTATGPGTAGARCAISVLGHAGSSRRDSGGAAGCLPDTVPAGGELGSALKGEHQACLSGDAFSGDVEGGAVVDRDPDHGEADSDVHPVVAVDGLEWRMAVVVIAGEQ